MSTVTWAAPNKALLRVNFDERAVTYGWNGHYVSTCRRHSLTQEVIEVAAVS
jgi:hypothetical protein